MIEVADLDVELRSSMNAIKHLGKTLSKPQMAALSFALTEGEVGPGAWGRVDGRTRRVGAPTVRVLVGAGLATGGTRGDGWVKLTAWGLEIARKVYEAITGEPWAPKGLGTPAPAERQKAPIPAYVPADPEFSRGYEAGFSAGYHEFPRDARLEHVETPYAKGWLTGFDAAKHALADSAAG